mgnify:CR=1 FL=1
MRQHRLLARERPLRAHADLLHHAADADGGVGVVVRHQNAYALELQHGLVLCRRAEHLEGDGNGIFRTLALFALNADGTAHHVDDVLADGHTEARAPDAADRRALLAGKGLEQMLLELLAHADAVVLNMELIGRVAVGVVRLPDDADDDLFAVLRVLDDVRQISSST